MDSQHADEGGSVWDSDEDVSAWAVVDVCSEDDEDDDDYAYVASDARYFSSDLFAKGGPESEESEDDEQGKFDQFDTESGTMNAHVELERSVYISPVSLPPILERVKLAD